MLTRLMLVMLFCCNPEVARELSDSDLEPVLSRSAEVFDNLPLAELAGAWDGRYDEYVFSLCLLENGDWGVSPSARDTGYWLNKESQQIEVFNCQTTISLKEYMKLSVHISNKRDDIKDGVLPTGSGAQWTIRGLRPCYIKKVDNDIAYICHAMPKCPSCQVNDNPATIYSQVKIAAGFIAVMLSVGLGYLGVSYAFSYISGPLEQLLSSLILLQE